MWKASLAAIGEHLTKSLVAIASVMGDARDPWWVIASAAVALHGADPGKLADVDVLLSPDDARHILPAIGVEPRQGADHSDFRSAILGVWKKTPLPVEFMAGFHYRSRNGWLPVQPTTRQAVEVGGATVFVPCREDLHRLLLAFGRPKDLERARLLAAIEQQPALTFV